ncbi:hypothetical protein KC343_g3250 [Hortaea werneckii]|nr:hypothetical protein KC352_g16571 [Hortaea werneckii]KAI7568751.1 hypothetical protein KC317_g3911 [Hortaea werneckii]KAI7623028.1 hypothetical protein KC346_g2931 [Hortaea werneckii]KAI7632851.1 hypothetical protein KC343_g3250 [Hortaea werneckii]KAI7676039.1 hypothetical protein KC319_g4462 [Hortaea werneckii]
MSGYYDKKLGYYTFVNGVSTQNSGPHHLGFHLHLSTRGDSLDHLHGFSDSIDDVISKWSGEPAFNHLTANDIREGIEAIQFRSHPNFAQDDGANLKGYERAATIEQLYGVAKLAAAISHTNEQDVQNTKTSLWALRADLDRLHATQTNLTAHIPPLQNNTTNLKAAAQFLNHRLNTLDATSHNLATTTTLLEQNLIHTTTELTQSQTQIADLQRAVQGMVQQIELLSTIARQNADVTEAKNQRIEELIQAAARDRGNLVELKDLDFLDGEVYVEVEEEEDEEE